MVPLVLAAFAGCQDATAPLASMPQFAQGDANVWTVNTLDDPGDGSCTDDHCTLRDAIAAATSGGTIVFSVAGVIRLEASHLRIDSKTLTIIGANRIAVDAQRLSRVLMVDGGSVSISGLSLINGYAPTGVGGGIFAWQSQLTLDEVTLAGNESGGKGGGISAWGGQTTIRNSTIHNNAAVTGGGIHTTSGAKLTLLASTISGNNAADWGGGVDNEGGQVELRSTTVTNNRGTAGGGLRNEGFMTLVNSLVAGNTATVSLTPNCGGPDGIGKLGYNLAGDDCGTVALPAGEVRVAPGQVFTQVLDAELKDNGGPTLTHALITGGLAVDAGYCPGETRDQRGSTRPVDDPAMPNARQGCDIGAYELQGPVAVNADLMVSLAVDRASVKQGELLTYFVRVQNLGPQSAPNVVVNNVLSNGVTFVEARSTNNRGTFTAPGKGETGTVTWYLDTLDDQASEVAEIAVTVLVKGRTTITNTATVAGDVVDPNNANNSAAITVSVASGSSGGSKKK